MGALENINKNNHLFDLLSYAFYKRHEVMINKILESYVDFKSVKNKAGLTVLHLAARFGHLGCIKAFLGRGISVNVQDNTNNTPMHLAMNHDTTEMLLKNGGDMNLLNDSGWSPIHNLVHTTSLYQLFISQEHFVDQANPNGETVCHALVNRNEIDIMKCYLERGHGNNVNMQNSNGYTPFHLAVLHGQVEMLTLISKYVSNPDLKNNDGHTPLELAIFYRNNQPDQILLVKLILELGAKVNLPNSFGNTAIHYAIDRQNLPLTMFLLESGADLKVKDKKGNTVLHISVFRRDDRITELLLKHLVSSESRASDELVSNQSLEEDLTSNNTVIRSDLVNVCNNIGKSPLHYAVEENWEEIVQLLIDHSASINTQDQEGFTPLMAATRKGHRKIAEQLFLLGADIDLSNSTLACTLLNDAIRYGCEFLVEHLLKKGMYINEKDVDGNTVLHVATQSLEKYELVLSLLDRGADVNIKNKEGKSPFHIALTSSFFNPTILERFFEKGADINLINKKGETVLHMVLGKGFCFETGSFLLNHGANVDALNYKNQTPLLCSLLTPHCCNWLEVDFIKLLLANGANPNVADDEGNTALKKVLGRMYNCLLRCEENCKSFEIIELLEDKMTCLEIDKIDYFEVFVDRAFKNNKLDLVKMFTKNESNFHGKHIILHLAVQHKCYELVDALMSKGVECDTNCSKRRRPVNLRCYGDDDKLAEIILKRSKLLPNKFDSALLSKISIYAKLLPKQGPPDDFDKGYLTQTLTVQHLGKALMLLDRGISLDVRDDEGCSPLQLAVLCGNVAIVKILLGKGVNVYEANNAGETALHTACQYNSVAIARVLIENGASVTAQDVKGRTPLHVIMYDRDTTDPFETVKLLVEKGASVVKTDLENNTPLHRFSGSLKVTKLLLEKGASVDAKNDFGHTPLHRTPSVDVARVLIEHGATVNTKDRNGNTPLHSCISEGFEITKLLLDNNASVDAKNDYGETALCEAVPSTSKERNAIVHLLIERGADCAIDSQYSSVLDLAIENEFSQLQILLDNGVKLDNCRYFKFDQFNPLYKPNYRTQCIVLVKHLSKLKLAGLPTPYNVETLEKPLTLCGDEINLTFFVSCLKELDKVRSTRVYEDFTLGDIINNYKNAQFLLDKYLVENLDALFQSPILPEEFPIYGYVLRNVYKELKRRRFYLLYLASLSMVEGSRNYECALLTEDAKEKIFEYLGDEDLQNLIKSGKAT